MNPKSNKARELDGCFSTGCLFPLAGLTAWVVLMYGFFVPGSFLDSAGWSSHTAETSISAEPNWLAGESKTCYSFTLDSNRATAENKSVGYAFAEINCDDGPKHIIKVRFYGMKNQPDKKVIFWNCTKSRDSLFSTEEGFVCKETSAV